MLHGSFNVNVPLPNAIKLGTCHKLIPSVGATFVPVLTALWPSE